MSTQPLSIPCDCQHCRDIRDKVTRATEGRRNVTQQIADAGYIYQGGLIADCERAVDDVTHNENFRNYWDSRTREVVGRAIRRAAEKAVNELDTEPPHIASKPGEMKAIAREIIERHIRQELGL